MGLTEAQVRRCEWFMDGTLKQIDYPGDQWPNNERDESEYDPAEPQGRIGPLGEQEKHIRWLVDTTLGGDLFYDGPGKPKRSLRPGDKICLRKARAVSEWVPIHHYPEPPSYDHGLGVVGKQWFILEYEGE